MKRLILPALLWALASPALATPLELRSLVQADRPAGCTDYSFLVWDLYRAELWTDAESPPGTAYGLSLTYQTDFSREKLVESSISEMARMSGRAESAFGEAAAEMTRAFRAVDLGDRITAWFESSARVRIFHNGTETGAITSEPGLFMDIWLGRKTRDEDGRSALLSGRCDG